MLDNREPMNNAEVLAKFLGSKNVPAVFQLSGGMIAFLIDAIFELGQTQIINLRHEQAAGFAAEGATRITGIPAVAMGTSGPGATNLITAIASSYFDSIPTLFITGQVNQNEMRKDKQQRQNGFQELEIVDAVSDITKFAIKVDSQSDLLELLEKAWNIALAGRPGPVLIDIPIDIQQRRYSGSYEQKEPSKTAVTDSSQNRIPELLSQLDESKRPLFLLGGGIRISGCTKAVRDLVTKMQIPAVYSLMGVDVLSSDDPLKIGMIGSYGNRWANNAIAQSDLVIALGTRLDVRQTGTDMKSFLKDKKIFRVDVDEYELSGRIKADISVMQDLSQFVSSLSTSNFQFSSSEWPRKILEDRKDNPQAAEQLNYSDFNLNPNDVMVWLSNLFAGSEGYFVDVGQHQMWAAQSIRLEDGQRFLTSGGLGAMGFALPAAIGAAVVSNGRWIVVSGDGCTQLSIAEFQTVKQLNLSIVICIINNEQHGMVAQFQESNMESRFVGTRDGYSAPNFVQIATAFGIEAVSVRSPSDFADVEKKVRTSRGPLVIEINVPREARALPKMTQNSKNEDI